MHLPALTSPLHSTGSVQFSHDNFLRKTQREHLSSSSAELFLKISQTRVAEEFTCSLYGMKGYMKNVNEARHVKLCQMIVKMDKVLVYPGYMGLFLLGGGNTST